MLTLNRAVGETIKIGDDIEIVLTNIRGRKATISIKAPRDLVILRGELLDKDASNERKANN